MARFADITGIRLCKLFQGKITFGCPHFCSRSLANCILSMSLSLYHLHLLHLKEASQISLLARASLPCKVSFSMTYPCLSVHSWLATDAVQ
uniref:Macaca fascicularis brain cDNA, clone: QflA-18290 n=1 Tax=Macaca fascicularis TaxID=9541 RepID=I7GMT6_MACFA|nr:unnamed protein product [Macaca fascicularis]